MAATHPGDGSRAHRPYLESRRTPFVSRPSSQGLESVSRLRGTAPIVGLAFNCFGDAIRDACASRLRNSQTLIERRGAAYARPHAPRQPETNTEPPTVPGAE